jgi:hypothetical protein
MDRPRAFHRPGPNIHLLPGRSCRANRLGYLRPPPGTSSTYCSESRLLGIVSPGKVLTAVPFHRIGAVKDQLEEIFRIVGQFVNGPPPATKEDHAIKYGIGRVGFEIDRIAPDAHSDLAQTIFPVVGKVVLAIVVE